MGEETRGQSHGFDHEPQVTQAVGVAALAKRCITDVMYSSMVIAISTPLRQLS